MICAYLRQEIRMERDNDRRIDEQTPWGTLKSQMVQFPLKSRLIMIVLLHSSYLIVIFLGFDQNSPRAREFRSARR